MDFWKAFVIASDLVFMAVLLYFVLPLKWSYEEDRSSIVGFGAMLTVLMLNIAMIFVARY